MCSGSLDRNNRRKHIDDCAVPLFGKTSLEFDKPVCTNLAFLPLLDKNKGLFRTSGSPGSTTLAEHFIPITGTPVKVSPRRIPANYRKSSPQEGIIEESSSPWLVPAVFVRKKNGDIRICVDYTKNSINRQLKMPIHFHDQMRYKID